MVASAGVLGASAAVAAADANADADAEANADADADAADCDARKGSAGWELVNPDDELVTSGRRVNAPSDVPASRTTDRSREPKRVYMVESKYQDFNMVDPHDNVLGHFLGHDVSWKVSRFLKRSGVRRFIYVSDFAMQAYEVFALSGSEHFDILPNWLYMILAYPLHFYTLLFMQKTHVSQLLFEFETQYLLATAAAVAVLLADLVRYDHRVVIVIHVFNAFVVFILTDAVTMSGKGKRIYVIPATVKIVAMMMVLEMSPEQNFRDLNLSFSVGPGRPLQMRTKSTCMQLMLVLLYFGIKCSSSVIFKPDCFLILKARLCTRKLPVCEIQKRFPMFLKSYAKSRGGTRLQKTYEHSEFESQIDIARSTKGHLQGGRLPDMWSDPELNLKKYSETSKLWVIVPEEKYIIPRQIHSQHTLIVALFGAAIAARAWKWITRPNRMIVILAVFVVGFSMIPFILSGTIPPSFTLGLVLTMPANLSTLLFMSPTILIDLLGSFELIYLLFTLSLWVGVMIDIIRDVRLVTVFSSAWCFGVIFLVDAQHWAAQRFLIIGQVCGILIACGFFALHFGGLYSGITIGEAHIPVLGGTFDSLTIADQRLFVVCSFFFKNMVIKFFRPGYFVVLKARLRMRRMTKSEIKTKLDDLRSHDRSMFFSKDPSTSDRKANFLPSIVKNIREHSKRRVFPNQPDAPPILGKG